jgi:uncharacterized protein with ParB-like and HNH nuclease domain
MSTEAREIFEANSKSVRDLLCENGLGLYIPAYQRPYGWDKEKVNKLVLDTFHGYIELSRSDESFTFLGTVITIHDINYTTVQPGFRPDVPAKLLNVIDGQQRLTTLLVFCLALHNQIRISYNKYFKSKKAEGLADFEIWLQDISKTVLGELESTFVERQKTGDSPLYPRMIRSFDDQWSKRKLHAKYQSPIAHLTYQYATSLDDEKIREFKANKRPGTIEGEEALCERFNQISKILKSLGEIEDDEDFEDLPSLKKIAQDSKFQIALLNHDFPVEVIDDLITSTELPKYGSLLQLILLANYLLSRVALTVVRGKNEDYAFTIFESLNTTGEPLTAFETFKPQVVMAEKLEQYENSKSKEHINHITDYLSTFKVGDPLQKATRELIITFASNETGYILSKRLADQRRYLKDEFDRYKDDQAQREFFIKNFSDVADFTKYAWGTQNDHIVLHGLPIEASSNVVKLCLSFLSSLNHSITVAPIIRFYSEALSAADADKGVKVKNLEDAIKAITAFSALWRASRRGTKNIDRQYREILVGANDKTTKAPPLSRTMRKGSVTYPTVDVDILKKELRARLEHKDFGDIKSKTDFVNQAATVPAYINNRNLSRFLLLAAYHDAVADPTGNGLIVKGKSAVSPCLTFEGFKEERNLTLEHIAPQDSSADWNQELYADKEMVHRIGNLVLVPQVANSSFSSRPWPQKRILYKVLGAVSHDVASKLLEDAKNLEGIEFGESTQELLENSKHLPQLSAIGDRAEDWGTDFIELRSKRLLELAYGELYKWLQ